MKALKCLFILFFLNVFQTTIAQITTTMEAPISKAYRVNPSVAVRYDSMKWYRFNGKLPELAMKIGSEADGSKQCPCRDSITKRVGKFLFSSQECLYAMRGAEVASKKFSILSGTGSYKLENWDEKTASTFNPRPYPTATKMGSGNMSIETNTTEELGLLTQELIYLGIFEYEGGLHIGKIYDHKRFMITYGGQTITGSLDKPGTLRPKKILLTVERPK
jgi:hypothetical protein